MTDKLKKNSDKEETKRYIIPILPLRNSVLFPGLIMPLIIGREKTLKLLDSVTGKDEQIGVVTQKSKDTNDPVPEDMYQTGTSAKILRIIREREHGVDIVVQGMERFRIVKYVQYNPFLIADVEPIPEDLSNNVEIEALIKNLKKLTIDVLKLIPEIPTSATDMVEQVDDPNKLVYLIASNLPILIEEKMQILESTSIKNALRQTLKTLSHHLEVLKVTQKINSEVKGELNKSQREYVLRQQMKAIQKELGEIEEEADVLDELKEKLEKAKLPEEARKIADKELKRLKTIQPSSPEYTVARTYLDWIGDLPWSIQTVDNLDVSNARKVLDEDHYDLDKVKKRILEYIAVSKLKQGLKGPILCFVGPPGVGKTSLGQSIARALGRKFVRISLGGVRDEAEIRGHRRTYIGALPGKIIQSLKRAGSNNPIFMLDEVDKLGKDWRGDPTSALLEVLDPEQNFSFMDHYLDIPFDLTKVLFITTANITDTIPPPLLDRMEMLELPGYTPEEKIQIARRHLIPKQVKEHGIEPALFDISDEMVSYSVDHYTREAGVRNLERSIASLIRGIAVMIVEGKWEQKPVDKDLMSRILGPEQFQPETAERTESAGIATGLAWTTTGGDILFVEATKMPGKGKLKLTGQLGDVMKESAQIAMSYLQSKSSLYAIEASIFDEVDIHIHVPAGAIPKDGPSAGITMFVALVSLFTGRKHRSDVALTGEITLRGLVLPIGGVKNKVLAAQRGGIKTVILPERNRKDLVEIPEQIKKELEFIFVRKMDEVLNHALEKLKDEDIPVTELDIEDQKEPAIKKKIVTIEQEEELEEEKKSDKEDMPVPPPINAE
jgi:ATP-dependent Lon protease